MPPYSNSADPRLRGMKEVAHDPAFSLRPPDTGSYIARLPRLIEERFGGDWAFSVRAEDIPPSGQPARYLGGGTGFDATTPSEGDWTPSLNEDPIRASPGVAQTVPVWRYEPGGNSFARDIGSGVFTRLTSIPTARILVDRIQAIRISEFDASRNLFAHAYPREVSPGLAHLPVGGDVELGFPTDPITNRDPSFSSWQSGSTGTSSYFGGFLPVTGLGSGNGYGEDLDIASERGP